MNEKRIQDLVQVEKQAQQILESAKAEAEHLPIQAEHEAQDLIEKARERARSDAKKLIDDARAETQVEEIMSTVQKKIEESEALGAKNLDRAVAFVLEQLLGQE
jgi:vacuolar-type H+-ATPase subunit H